MRGDPERPLSALRATSPAACGGRSSSSHKDAHPELAAGGAVTITAKDGGMQASAKDGSESQVTEGAAGVDSGSSIVLRSVAL